MKIPENLSALRIWPGLAPGETTADSGRPGDPSGNVCRWTDVTAPDLFLFGGLAPARRPAILVCPGGGYEILAMDLEGFEIADWLVELGFVVAVLRYRVPKNRDGAFADGQRALSWLRSRAADYNIDPDRVGALGFSAGGHLVTRLASANGKRCYAPVDDVDGERCRPDFVLPIYPAWLVDPATGEANAEVAPHTAMAPLFLAQSADDAHLCSEAYAAVARKAGVKVRSELYSTGGHGYGLRLSGDVPASRWPLAAAEWLRETVLR